MKTFDEEKKELFDWSTKVLKHIDTKYPYIPGRIMLDGPEDAERKEHFREYNRRLADLKAKHGI